MKGITTTVIIASILLIFILIGYLLFSSDITNKEAGLISLLLTILSVIVSYIVSHHFAESGYKKAIEEVKQQHQENLKVYALNAAEKVGNLSSELTKLSIYIQNEIDYEDDDDKDNLEEINLSLEERLRSTIHIVNTLKSINDTSLSDWRGVIGEELQEQKEEQLEREQLLIDLIERVESLQNINTKNSNTNSSNKEIKELNNKINLIFNSISGSNLPRIKSSKKPIKEDISNECPECKNTIVYKQRPNEKSFKPIKCDNCGKKATARYDKIKGFYLLPEAIMKSSEQCLWCQSIINIEHSNIPFSSKIEKCENCSGQMKVSTNINGIQLRKYGNKPKETIVLTEEIIEKTDKLLPDQPWPVGTHKQIAHQLEIPENIISAAINELIKRGKYLVQIDGELFEKTKNK